jgi:hypothetical protein
MMIRPLNPNLLSRLLPCKPRPLVTSLAIPLATEPSQTSFAWSSSFSYVWVNTLCRVPAPSPAPSSFSYVWANTLCPSAGTITHTVQFRVQDIRLWRQGVLLSNFASEAELLQADAVTLYLENQKNGQKGATIHHTAVEGWFCPVKALARRVAAITSPGLGADTPLSCVSPGIHVASHHIVTTVREAARLTYLQAHGYDLRRVGAYSLRASGAMAMKLNGVDAERIKKVGRWTSSTFLIYIHSQIAALNVGLAQRMVNPIYFQNVGE